MPPSDARLSACVLAFQEADRIADCLRSLDFCDSVLVVDSGSTDRTRDIAIELGAEVVVREPFPGFRQQRQTALDLARHDHVLLLDADERVTPQLRTRILELRDQGFPAAGYSMPRLNHYLGKIVRRGLWWPDHKLRLVDRRRANVGGVDPHDRLELIDGSEPVVLREPLEHLNYRSFRHHLRTIDRYTAASAVAHYESGRRVSVLDLLVRPPAVFIKSLVVKFGFLDGWRGLLIAAMAFWYDALKYTRMLGVQRRRKRASA